MGTRRVGICTGVGVEVVVVFGFGAWLCLGEVVIFNFFKLDHLGL